jgi:hypothetical protein
MEICGLKVVEKIINDYQFFLFIEEKLKVKMKVEILLSEAFSKLQN